MHDAISYKRFSSPKQGRGDSYRRQTDLTEEYCKRHHLRLIDTYLDAGLSGFTGENLNDGSALRALLHAAEAGKFKPGTRLIVESLDRLSRREISTAVRLFLDILDAGLVIVTLIDGEQVFTRDRVDTDLTALIIVIVYLSRANNESRNKRERAREAQQTARRRARESKTPITAECPSWLRLAGKGPSRHFVVDRERARVIEHIFEMASSDHGQIDICMFLNEHGVATFSGRPKWRPGMIAHLLASDAVVGRFHPCFSVVEHGRRRRVRDPEGPIERYYPAIVSESLFKRARVATAGRLRRGRLRQLPAYRNLVARICRCAACGGPLHYFESGGWSYLRCSGARYRECSNRLGFPYRKLEAVLFAFGDLTELVTRLVAEHSGKTKRLARPPAARKRERDDALRIELAEREAFVARFPEARLSAESGEAAERDRGRRVLIAEFRRIIEAVVLNPDRTLTIHLKPDVCGDRFVYVLDADGIAGVQVKAPEGRTGFIDRSVLIGMVRPVRRGPDDTTVADAVWRPRSLREILGQTRIACSAGGDWHATASDPMQLVGIVRRAEEALLQ